MRRLSELDRMTERTRKAVLQSEAEHQDIVDALRHLQEAADALPGASK